MPRLPPTSSSATEPIGTDAADPAALPRHTFLFADLAGFTALTEAHGDERATDVAVGFFDEVAKLLPDHRAQRVKTIGDALMVRGEDAGECVCLALRIANEIGAQHGFPMVRVGLNTGPAVERDGDWFGGTVNLAARVTSLAAGGEILAPEATRQAAGTPPGVEWQARGARAFKNVAQQVSIFAALSSDRSTTGMVVDPVCRMCLEPANAVGQLTHEGASYHFCSLRCVSAFAAGPDDYAKDAIAERTG